MRNEKCMNLPKTKIFLHKDKKIKKRNDKFLMIKNFIFRLFFFKRNLIFYF